MPRRDCGRLGGAYWALVAVAALFTLARFSEAFLVLRAPTVGLPVALVPLVLVVDERRLCGCAYPAGCCRTASNRVRVLASALRS